MMEVLHWLLAQGIALASAQATLRRKLASEGSSLSELLIEARMAAVFTLLQATTYPVSHIALFSAFPSALRLRANRRTWPRAH